MELIENILKQLKQGWFAFNKKNNIFTISEDWNREFLDKNKEQYSDKEIIHLLNIRHPEHFIKTLHDCSEEKIIRNYFVSSLRQHYIINAHTSLNDPNIIVGTIQKGDELYDMIDGLKEAVIEAKNSDRLKSIFLANMAHDIRVPLNGISGFAEMMIEDDFAPEEKREFAEIIERNTDKLVNIINDIIDVSKIEAGQVEIINSTFDPEKVILDLFNQYQSVLERSKKYDIKLKLKLPNTLKSPLLHTDQLRIKQIFDQLLSNAIKFTHTGSITFGYKMLKSSQIELFVADTGIGIPIEEQKKVFTMFKKDDKQYTKPYGKNGLGLYIANNLSKLLGSELNLQSEPGVGTRLSFIQPIHDKQEKHISKPHYTKHLKSPWTNKKILIVDDIKEIYEYVRLSLRHSNVTCLYANSGEGAINIMNCISDIDLILMDIQMPNMNGITTLQTLRSQNINTPVIALTAFAMSGDKEQFLSQGFNEYISKPLKQNELFRVLKAHL